jgi:hypothetical protein
VLGVITTCMPCLKHPAEERIGVLGEQYFPGMSRSSFVLSRREEGLVEQGQFQLQDAGSC